MTRTPSIIPQVIRVCLLKYLHVFLFLLLTSPLMSDVEDHFKRIPHKTGGHSLPNIDFIYMINLDQRPEKFAASCKAFLPYQITPYRFSAVNGWELPIDVINDIGVKYGPWMSSEKLGTCYLPEQPQTPHHEPLQIVGRTYFCHCMSRGAIGIALSHLSVLQDAYDSGYETIWVMEDDIEVIQDPHLLSVLVDKLDQLAGKDGWDILFTDQDTKNREGNYVPCTSCAWRPNYSPADPGKFCIREDVSPDFRIIGARYGAYSMIVRRSGIEKILNFLKGYDLFLPYDLEYPIVPGIRMYAVRQDVVSTQPQALSDNGAPNYFRGQNE